jgi:hypothetical protein
MKKLLSSMALSVALVAGVATQADAKVSLEFPLWEINHSNTSLATTNIFCSSDIADAVTLAFYSSTYTNFYSTTQSWTTTGGYFTYLGATDTAFTSAVANIDSASVGYVFGPLRAIFKNSSRGNLSMVTSSSAGTTAKSGKGYGYDPLSNAWNGVGGFSATPVEVTAGNNSGCFVDVIVGTGLSFSVPENSNTKQNPLNN